MRNQRPKKIYLTPSLARTHLNAGDIMSASGDLADLYQDSGDFIDSLVW